MAETRDIEIPGRRRAIPARLYVPSGVADRSPGLLYLHGGGWVIGSPDTHDRLTRELAAAIGARVVSLHYALAPEHPYPEGLDDCVDAALYLGAQGGRLGIDPARLLIGGDSAGGNLSAATLLRPPRRAQPGLRRVPRRHPDLRRLRGGLRLAVHDRVGRSRPRAVAEVDGLVPRSLPGRPRPVEGSLHLAARRQPRRAPAGHPPLRHARPAAVRLGGVARRRSRRRACAPSSTCSRTASTPSPRCSRWTWPSDAVRRIAAFARPLVA